jgi:glyoxylase-like metal-dependent hydrolase (beta-lactamase superfamily II)
LVAADALREGDGFNLIDTTTAGEELAILAALAEIEGRPVDEVRVHEVLLTHGHDDHTGSAAALMARTGARVVASRDEADVIAGKRAAVPPQLADWEVPPFEQVTPKVPHAPPVVPDRLVDHGDRLGWEHDGLIVAAPGHTPGHVAAWFEADRVLVAGDALASYDGRPMVGVFNAEPAVAAASARRLASLDAEVACFGHGEPLRRDASARLAELAGDQRPGNTRS